LDGAVEDCGVALEACGAVVEAGGVVALGVEDEGVAVVLV
jgi:hypothetical protein